MPLLPEPIYTQLKAIAATGDDRDLPDDAKRTRAKALEWRDVKERDEVDSVIGMVTIIGPGRGKDTVLVGWIDRETNIPCLGTLFAHQLKFK